MSRTRTSQISTRAIATAAWLSISAFPVVVIGLNLLQHRSYDPLVQAISELALGAGGAAMVVAFLGLGLGIALLAVVLQRTCEGGRPIRWMLYLAALLAGPMSAFFHADLTGHPATTEGTIHDNSGLAAFLIILLSMYATGRLFRHEPAWHSHATTTMIWAVVATLAFFLIPALPSHFGLAQRIFVGMFIAWLLATTMHARRFSVTVGHRPQVRGDQPHATITGA